jgi:hypothetical protein
MNQQLTPTQLEAYNRKKAFDALVSKKAKEVVEPVSPFKTIELVEKPIIIPELSFIPKKKKLPVSDLRTKGRRQIEQWKKEEKERILITKQKMREALKERSHNNFQQLKKISLDTALKYRDYDVTYDDLFSPRRSKGPVLARHECFYRARMETTKSLPEIGLYYGGRDHTTVLSGVRKYKSLQEFIYRDGPPQKYELWFPQELIIDPSTYEVSR